MFRALERLNEDLTEAAAVHTAEAEFRAHSSSSSAVDPLSEREAVTQEQGYEFEGGRVNVGEVDHTPINRHESEGSFSTHGSSVGREQPRPDLINNREPPKRAESEKLYWDETDGSVARSNGSPARLECFLTGRSAREASAEGTEEAFDPPLAAVEELVETGASNLSYDELNSRLRRQRALYKDHDFPPTTSSLTYSGRNVSSIRWKRPKDIITDPQFVTKGISRFDLDQGALGNCWFVAAAATLAIHTKLFERVVPAGQGFGEGYTGLFRFNIWVHGSWQEVLVDDLLPTYHGRLYYSNNNEQPNEFWCALLEKAFAKVNGSYEAIDGGRSFEALVDFTGGISETIALQKMNYTHSELFNLVQRTFAMNSLQCGGIWQIKGATREQELVNGLFTGHAYSITGIAKMNIRGGRKEELLRLRNPWGRGEWNQRWSDGSSEWNALSQQDKDKLLYRPLKDGEFWMPFEDFCKNFDSLEICHLTPDSLTEEIAKDTEKKQWKETTHHGEWTKFVNAGGCGNPPHNDKYWINPQYHVKLDMADSERNDGKATLVISLTQKYRRRLQNTLRNRKTFVAIGVAIWKLRRGESVRLDGRNYDRRALLHSKTIDVYSPKREVCMRERLSLGDYIIIPSTFDPDVEAQFMLRVFTEVKVTSETVEEPTTVVVDPEEKQTRLLQDVFNKLKGSDGSIDYRSLAKIMNALFEPEVTEGFTRDGARQMIASFDHDKSGSVDFFEFQKIIKRCMDWRGVFKQYDRNKNTKINIWELRAIMEDMGHKLGYRTLRSIVRWYGDREGQMAFEDFIVCVFRLFGAAKVFNRFRPSGDTRAVMSMDDWLVSAFNF